MSAADITINLKGLKDLDRTIEALQPQLKKAAYKAVISAGARVILRSAKAKVPRDTGLLKKALGIKAKVYGNSPYAVIGPRRKVQGEPKSVKGKGGFVRNSVKTPWRYAHLVEFGTAHAAAQPFIRPALDDSKSQVHAALAQGLEKYLHRTLKRIRKNRNK